MKQPKIYDPYNRLPEAGITFAEGTGKTDQSQVDDCDINKIMARYKKLGVLPPETAVKQFIDVSNIGDYHSSMNAILAAQDAFMQLDARIREAFENDPALLIAALEDPSQKEKLVSLGLVSSTESLTQGGAAPEETLKKATSGKPQRVKDETEKPSENG